MPQIYSRASDQVRVFRAEVLSQLQCIQPIRLAVLESARRQIAFKLPENIAALKPNRQLRAPQPVGDKSDGVAQLETLPGSMDRWISVERGCGSGVSWCGLRQKNLP